MYRLLDTTRFRGGTSKRSNSISNIARINNRAKTDNSKNMQTIMIRREVEKERTKQNTERLRTRYVKETNMYLKELENYKKIFETIPQVVDSNAWKKVNISTLKTLVKFKRRKEDDKEPTSKVELQRIWSETLNRPNMTMNERLNENKLSDKTLIAEILLDMSNTNTE